MLTFAQSITIARRSIKAVSGINIGDIDQNDTLERAGIADPDGLRLVKRLACLSQEFGVPKFNHELAFAALDEIQNDSIVRDFANAIQENAEEQAS